MANGRQARAEAALTSRAYGVMGNQVSRAGKVIAGAFAVGALVKAGAAITKTGGEYVNSLNKIKALTGASNAQMDRAAKQLESNAQAYAKMGQTTGDAATGVVELTKAGLSLDKSLKAVRATMVLAKAGELSVADASTLVANTLNTFNLKAGRAKDIANGLANAANISSADVSDLAESFKYVAPLAAKAHVSLDQTNAVLAELSNSGVKASQAGTGFRKFLLSLQAPGTAANVWLDQMNVHLYDAQGKMRPLAKVIGELRTGVSKLSDEDQNYALKSIFGLTGVNAAQIILKGGVKGLKDYTKGVQRAGAAQKLANAQSKGFLGTLQRLKASGTSTVQALYRELSPKLNKPLSEAADWLAKNQDQMIDTAEAAASKLAPALETLWSITKSVAEAVKDTAVPLAEDLLPAVKTLAGIAMDAAKAVDGLPQPIKEIGVQAGIAALLLPKLTTAVTTAGTSIRNTATYTRVLAAEMRDPTTRARNLSTAFSRLGGAARNVAGVGGMVALSQASKTSNHAMGALLDTLGGAATGFAIAGPIGALIGGGAGGLLGLYNAAKKAEGAADDMKAHWAGLRDTLDQVTGATTEATKAFVYDELQRSKVLPLLNQYGISSRNAVAAIMGEKGARRQVGMVIQSEAVQRKAALRQVTALQKEYNGVVGSGAEEELKRAGIKSLIDQYQAEADAHKHVIDEIRSGTGALKADVRSTRQKAAATADLTGKLKAIPKSIRPKIQAEGIIPTRRGVAEVAQQFKLVDKKQIRALIKASGADTTVKAVQRVIRTADAARKAAAGKLDMGPFLNSINAGLTKGLHQAQTGGQDVKNHLEDGPRNAKADLSRFSGSLQSGAAHAAGVAHSGGTQIGGAMKAGVIAGFSGTASALAAQAAAAVAGAIGSAKKAGAIRSPSRKMRAVGQFLGDGLADGMERRKGKARAAGKHLVQQVLRGADRGLDGIKTLLGRITHLVESKLDGKKQAGRRKALLHSLKDEKKALLANGRAQDANSKKLDKAISKYKDLKRTADDFARSIRTGFRDYGSVVGLGTVGGGTAVTLPALLSQLTARAGVAGQFAKVIEQLKGRLNKTSLRQILNQAASGDLEGALATAQTIASGGGSAIKQINRLTAKINKAGGKLGQDMRRKFYGAGLHAADGLVKGLEKKQRQLDKVAERLAQALVRRVRRALGIHSPSRVFAQIGQQTADGLTLGIKARDTYVHRAGATLASTLQSGFGTPALAAVMSAPAGSSSAPTFTVEVQLTAQQLSEIEKGRRAQISLDAYHSAGGRSKLRAKSS